MQIEIQLLYQGYKPVTIVLIVEKQKAVQLISGRLSQLN